jgi:hypothetical protein
LKINKNLNNRKKYLANILFYLIKKKKIRKMSGEEGVKVS